MAAPVVSACSVASTGCAPLTGSRRKRPSRMARRKSCTALACGGVAGQDRVGESHTRPLGALPALQQHGAGTAAGAAWASGSGSPPAAPRQGPSAPVRPPSAPPPPQNHHTHHHTRTRARTCAQETPVSHSVSTIALYTMASGSHDPPCIASNACGREGGRSGGGEMRVVWGYLGVTGWRQVSASTRGQPRSAVQVQAQAPGTQVPAARCSAPGWMRRRAPTHRTQRLSAAPPPAAPTPARPGHPPPAPAATARRARRRR
jgi:hypothetical protein